VPEQHPHALGTEEQRQQEEQPTLGALASHESLRCRSRGGKACKEEGNPENRWPPDQV
jgi:hypothetical protein